MGFRFEPMSYNDVNDQLTNTASISQIVSAFQQTPSVLFRFLQNIPVAIILVTESGIIVDANDCFISASQQTHQDIIGHDLSQFLDKASTGDIQKRSFQSFQLCLQNGEHWTGSLEPICIDGLSRRLGIFWQSMAFRQRRTCLPLPKNLQACVLPYSNLGRANRSN